MRQHLGETFEATVLGAFRPESGLYAILIDALGLETITRVPWDAAPGERVAVEPIDADPPGGFYRLSVVGNLGGGGGEETEEEEQGSGGAQAGGASDGTVDMEAVWAAVEAQRRDEDGADGGGGEDGAAAAAAAGAARAAGLLVAMDVAAALARALEAAVQG
jgi:hypothetical protein